MAEDPPDLNLLAAFAAIHAAGSVTEAARRRGIGQPAMSAALGRLRKLFGDELFVRAGGRLRPTPRAEEIAPAIAAAIATLRATLERTAAFDPRSAEHRFTIAASDYTTLVLMPAVLAALRARAPGVRLRVIAYDKDEAASLLDHGEVDLLLGTFRDPPARSVATMLFRERFIGLARRDHPALAEHPMSVEAYLAHPHALFTTRGDMQGEIDDILARKGRSRRIVFSVPHLLTLPAMLAGSDLLAAVPARLAAALGSAPVATFALPVGTEEWRVMMLWNPATRRDQARSFLREVVRRAAASV
jgi:DNA-binding transcriptional LysR family regulator